MAAKQFIIHGHFLLKLCTCLYTYNVVSPCLGMLLLWLKFSVMSILTTLQYICLYVAIHQNSIPCSLFAKSAWCSVSVSVPLTIFSCIVHRAIYRRADVYLLDDPLSAVDTVVGRRLFEACLKGVLSSSVVVLVTHQLQYAQLADTMLVVDQVHGSFCHFTCLIFSVFASLLVTMPIF